MVITMPKEITLIVEQDVTSASDASNNLVLMIAVIAIVLVIVIVALILILRNR